MLPPPNQELGDCRLAQPRTSHDGVARLGVTPTNTCARMGYRSQPSVSTLIFVHAGRTMGTWKTPPDGANRTQAGSLCYITPSRRHPGCTAIALRVGSERSLDSRENNIAQASSLCSIGAAERSGIVESSVPVLGRASPTQQVNAYRRSLTHAFPLSSRSLVLTDR